MGGREAERPAGPGWRRRVEDRPTEDTVRVGEGTGEERRDEETGGTTSATKDQVVPPAGDHLTRTIPPQAGPLVGHP